MTGRHAAPLCFLTDFAGGEERLCALLSAGISWVQYRDKTSPRSVLYGRAMQIRAITHRFGALFIMNDHADIAVAVDADGVHLGQDDLPLSAARMLVGQRIIGISTHCVAEAVAAEHAGADYIGFGPVFETATKDAGIPKGADALREIRSAVTIPIIAIGGIGAEHCPGLLAAGASGVAVASALQVGISAESARCFLDALQAARVYFQPK
jgi:thiamine-phosphate pyrophosphorylase